MKVYEVHSTYETLICKAGKMNKENSGYTWVSKFNTLEEAEKRKDLMNKVSGATSSEVIAVNDMSLPACCGSLIWSDSKSNN